MISASFAVGMVEFAHARSVAHGVTLIWLLALLTHHASSLGKNAWLAKAITQQQQHATVIRNADGTRLPTHAVNATAVTQRKALAQQPTANGHRRLRELDVAHGFAIQWHLLRTANSI